MQKSHEDFYTLAVFKPKPKAAAVFAGSPQNTIFNQKALVDINAIQLERIALAEVELEKAAIALMGAEAALVGFDEIQKKELSLAQNFTHAYIYMLREYVYQAKIRREAAAQTPKVRVA
jgi:hypothetical protein